MARPKNVALRGSTALAAGPRHPETHGQLAKDLLNVLRMP
jgi:hypothetical protein